jgi:hypothetical protein
MNYTNFYMFFVIIKNYWQLVFYAESWKCADFCVLLLRVMPCVLHHLAA